jgi:acetyl-CoA carboxylase / biotin carboxylase 1
MLCIVIAELTIVRDRFPADDVISQVSRHADALKDTSERNVFMSLTSSLRETADLYTKSKAVGVPGSERVLRSFISLIRSWISVERWFCDGRAYADAMDGLRKAFKDEPNTILNICRAHEQLCATSEVVSRIIAAVADGSRVDFDAVTPSAIGKRVSVVAGAAGLAEALPAIAEVGNMGSSDEYAELALRARKVVMHASMPSLEERRQKVLAAAKALSATAAQSQSREVEELLADHIPMVDVFFPLLKSVSSREEAVGLLELHVRHLFRPYTIKSLQRDTMQRVVRFSFVNKPSESLINASTSVTSMTDLTRMVSSGSLAQLHESADLSESSRLASNCKEKIPDSMTRVGVEVIVDTLDDLRDESLVDSVLSKFPQFASDAAAGSEFGPVNALYFVVLGPTVDLADTTQDDVALRCQTAIAQYSASLTKSGVRRVSFVFDQEQQDDLQNYPALFTFRYPEYQEDSLYRRIDPSLAIHLDLNRFAANFRIRSLGSRHTATCDVHVYEGVPRASALALDKTARRSPRTFARSLSFALEFSSSSFERILVDSLNAFDLWRTKSKSDNHLFLNLVSDYEKTVLDPVVVEQVVVAILKRHGERVSGLGIIEVEMRIVCCLSANTPPIAIRLFASNPTGYVHVMNTYVEAASQSGNERIFKLISGTKASLASAGDSSWDGLNVNTPYPLTRPFDAQRSAALRSSDTLYCYDLPALFEAAVEEQWVGASGLSGAEGGVRASARPLMVMYTQELVVQKKGGSRAESWTMSDYLKDELELIPTARGAGANDVGMVAWLVVLKTVEYPNVRIDS